MPPKISLKYPLFVISLAGIALSSIIILFLIFDLPVQGFYSKPAALTSKQISPRQITGKSAAASAVSGLPTRLKIPKINVESAMEYVGLAPDGAMDIPKSKDDVAWFELGPRPGETGSAVIAGHYGRWENGGGSVFDNLHKLRPGDKLYVEDDKGAIITFVVDVESKIYH